MTRVIGWLFDDRTRLVRLAVLLVLGVGYLLLLTDPAKPPSLVDWAFALTSILAGSASSRWPLVTVLAQAALLAAGFRFGDTGPVVVKIGAALALFELGMRCNGWRLALGAGVVVAAYLLHPDGGAPALLYRAVTVVGPPVLLGGYVRSVRDLSAHAQQRAEEERRRRLSETRAARADERATIARELHDLVAHHVASMVLRVGVARHVLHGADRKVRDVLDDVHVTGTTALADLRRLVAMLRDPAGAQAVVLVEPAELAAALSTVTDRIRRLGIEVTEDVDPGVAQLDAIRGLALLRLTQEGLANVAKHAGQGARATVSVRLDADGAAHIDIVDDGGRLPAQMRGDGGHGLIGMRERVGILCGSLEAGRQGIGWRLSAVLPAGAPTTRLEAAR